MFYEIRTYRIKTGAVLTIIPDGVYSNGPWQRVTVTEISGNVVSFTPACKFEFTHRTQVSGVGGHWPRAGWFSARADGKPLWAKGGVEAGRTPALRQERALTFSCYLRQIQFGDRFQGGGRAYPDT